jgi:hypothetical protein
MFNEIYFWMYSYLRNIKGNSNPPLNAYLLVSVLQGFNIIMIWGIINYFYKYYVGRNNGIYIGLALAAVLFSINHFYLYSKRGEIFQKYEILNPERRRKGKLYFWLYVILSLVLFFYLAATLVTPRY